MNAFGVVHKGYGVARAYKQALTPAARAVGAKAGKLRPVRAQKLKAEPKHKKPQQLGF